MFPFILWGTSFLINCLDVLSRLNDLQLCVFSFFTPNSSKEEPEVCGALTNRFCRFSPFSPAYLVTQAHLCEAGTYKWCFISQWCWPASEGIFWLCNQHASLKPACFSIRLRFSPQSVRSDSPPSICSPRQTNKMFITLTSREQNPANNTEQNRANSLQDSN